MLPDVAVRDKLSIPVPRITTIGEWGLDSQDSEVLPEESVEFDSESPTFEPGVGALEAASLSKLLLQPKVGESANKDADATRSLALIFILFSWSLDHAFLFFCFL